jgi:hypothetical protein
VSRLAVARAIVTWAYEFGSELWREHRRAKRKQREADAWANTPAPVRACPKCREVAYVPRQTGCTKCGAAL